VELLVSRRGWGKAMTIKVDIKHVEVGGDKDKQLFIEIGGKVWILEAGAGCSPRVTKDQSIRLFYDRRTDQRRERGGNALHYWTERAFNGG
jgi:hypothetical protein